MVWVCFSYFQPSFALPIKFGEKSTPLGILTYRPEGLHPTVTDGILLFRVKSGLVASHREKNLNINPRSSMSSGGAWETLTEWIDHLLQFFIKTLGGRRLCSWIQKGVISIRMLTKCWITFSVDIKCQKGF